MKALDTNVIIRFLVNDDKKQARAVRTLFEQAVTAGDTFFISIAVLLETLWVLKSVYECSREEIVHAIESLASMSIIEFEKIDTIHSFIHAGLISNTGLDDLLIGLIGRDTGCDSTITFDRNAARSDLFELIG